MKDSKGKILECLTILEDVIVVARYKMNPHEAESAVITRNYIMRITKISEQELSEFQINRRVENFKDGI